MTPSQDQNTTINCCPLCGQLLKAADIAGQTRQVCKPCDFVHWNNPKPVTVTLVPKDDGLVLVQRRCEPFVGGWCLPGGFIEASEHPEQAAAREVLEETGLNIEIDRLLDATTPGHNINMIVLFYLAKPASGKVVAGDDASDARVFHRDELPDNIPCTMHRKMIYWWFDKETLP